MERAPRRIQLSRAKGWRMPPDTVKVDRSTGYGNPFTVSDRLRPGTRTGGVREYIAVPTPEDAVACFRELMASPGERADAYRALLPAIRGKNLACWCKPGAPCHADVLLELANQADEGGRNDGSLGPGTNQKPIRNNP